MLKTKFTRPTLILMMGLPGSGKSYTSRHTAESLGAAHISYNRIQEQLFESPTFDKNETLIITNLMSMMTEEYLKLGVSVIFDMGLNRFNERRTMRELARKYDAIPVLLWLQIDQETARLRAKVKDKRKADDKFTAPVSNEVFDSLVQVFQQPRNEDYVVISGKYDYVSQKPIILRKLKELGLVDDELVKPNIAKPELVNLAAQARAEIGRIDYNRRNIIIG